MTCLVLADAWLEKFGADSVAAIDEAVRAEAVRVRARLTPAGRG
jgi:hypothetical protein